ncbi:MAG TPA: ACT domain-containing protein [Actinomycetota bacterium]|nr:ACT domain-containing protein [Actinomycetota bacterium]
MHVAVTAVGGDRPGIVASVSRVLYDVGGNIEDSRMAILGGHFAMVLIVSLPDDADPKGLERALAEPAGALGLITTVRPVADAPPPHATGTPYVVSVYGADKPGSVWQISEALAAAKVNISDLATHVVGDQEPVYVMILEVDVPPGADPEMIGGALKVISSELGVDVAFNPMEADTL